MGMGAVNDNEKVKERRAEHFENVLNCDRVTGKDIEEYKKFVRPWM